MSSLAGQIVVPYPPACPPGAAEINIYADSPLELANTNRPHDTERVIANDKTFKLQRVIVGAGHDPSEKGTEIELIYKDATEHVVARFFAENSTYVVQFGDLTKARDATSMAGNGSTFKFIVRRTRLSSSGQRVDVHVQGYEE
jgi:hypothetical protein